MEVQAKKMNFKRYTEITSLPEWLRVEFLINDAFYDYKIINWKILDLACQKIERVKNGSWMFDVCPQSNVVNEVDERCGQTLNNIPGEEK